MSDDWLRSNYKIEGYLESDIRTCLEKNEDTYINRFLALPQRRFNFCAAVFGGRWFVYRLMLKEGCLLWFANMIVSYSVDAYLLVMGIRRNIDMNFIRTTIKISEVLIYFIFFFIQGFIADSIYWKCLKRDLNDLGRQNSMEPATEEEIEKMRNQTGVSIRGVILFSVLWWFASKIIINLVITPFVFWKAGL